MIYFNKARVNYNLKFMHVKLKSLEIFEKTSRKNEKNPGSKSY